MLVNEPGGLAGLFAFYRSRREGNPFRFVSQAGGRSRGA